MINKLLKYFGYKLIKISDSYYNFKIGAGSGIGNHKTFAYNPEDFKDIKWEIKNTIVPDCYNSDNDVDEWKLTKS